MHDPQSEVATHSDGLPEGVFQNGQRQRYDTPEAIRSLANEEANALTHVGGYDNAAAYREALSPGDEPWEIFTRTEFQSVDDVRFQALELALAAPRLRKDPLWNDAPFVHMPTLAAAYWLEDLFMMSYLRKSRYEGTMMQTQMLAPDMVRGLEDSNKRGRRR